MKRIYITNNDIQVFAIPRIPVWCTPILGMVSSSNQRLKKILSSTTRCTKEATAYANCVLKSENTLKGTCQKEFYDFTKCIKVQASK